MKKLGPESDSYYNIVQIDINMSRGLIGRRFDVSLNVFLINLENATSKNGLVASMSIGNFLN